MIALLYPIHKFLLLPHVVLYNFSKNKAIINDDIHKWSGTKKRDESKIKLLLHFLSICSDFRTFFYFRLNNPITRLENLYSRKQSNFTIDKSSKLCLGILTGHHYYTILNTAFIGENFYVNHLVTIGKINGKRPTIYKL